MGVAEDRAELERLEDEWMARMQARDMDRLEELVAPGFRFMAIHLHPEPMSREQWMEAARSGYTIVSYAYERMDVDFLGDPGVTPAPYPKRPNFEQTTLSTVFRPPAVGARGARGGRVVARHSSILG